MKALTSTPNGTAVFLANVADAPNLYAGNVTPSLPSRQITIGQFPDNNPNWSRQIQVSDEYLFVKRGAYGVAIPLNDLVSLALTQEANLTWTPPVIITDPVDVSVTAGNVAALNCLGGSEYNMNYGWRELSKVSDNSNTLSWNTTQLSFSSTTFDGAATITGGANNVTNNENVTIGPKAYTFKTSLTPTEGEVLIGANTNASMLNLIRAINHTGTPNTDYKCAAVHPSVTAASSVSSSSFEITNKALATASIYAVSTNTLNVTPATTGMDGTQYYCVIVDDATSPGSVSTARATLTVS